MSKQFSLAPDTFSPRGDQPAAIEGLVDGSKTRQKDSDIIGSDWQRKDVYSCKCSCKNK